MAYFKEFHQSLEEKRLKAIEQLPLPNQNEVKDKGCALYCLDAVVFGCIPDEFYNRFFSELGGSITAGMVLKMAETIAEIASASAQITVHGAKIYPGIDRPPAKLSRRGAEGMVESLGSKSLGILLLSKFLDQTGHASCLINEVTENGPSKKIIYLDTLRNNPKLLTRRQAANLVRRKQVNGCIINIAVDLQED